MARSRHQFLTSTLDWNVNGSFSNQRCYGFFARIEPNAKLEPHLTQKIPRPSPLAPLPKGEGNKNFLGFAPPLSSLGEGAGGEGGFQSA